MQWFTCHGMKVVVFNFYILAKIWVVISESLCWLQGRWFVRFIMWQVCWENFFYIWYANGMKFHTFKLHARVLYHAKVLCPWSLCPSSSDGDVSHILWQSFSLFDLYGTSFLAVVFCTCLFISVLDCLVIIYLYRMRVCSHLCTLSQNQTFWVVLDFCVDC